MSRWSNRSASAGLALLLAACHSLPSHPDATPLDSQTAGTDAGDNGAGDIALPADAARQYEAAVALGKAGHSAEAEREFERLAAAYPGSAASQLNLGILYLEAGRLLEAEGAFKGALERHPGNAVAGNELGIVERRLGKFAEAEAAYQRTIAAEPNYAPAYLNLGVLYDLYMGEPKKALEQFEHYLALAGDNKQVAGWVAELRKRVATPAVKKDPA